MFGIIKIFWCDQVYFKLESENSILIELHDFVKYKVKNHQFSPSFKFGSWDGTISFFNFKDRKFPIGLWNELKEFCEKNHYEYHFRFDTKVLKNNYTEEQLQPFLSKILKDAPKITMRDYQINAFMKAINSKRGVYILATGAGKSLFAYSLVRFALANNLRVLLMVPNQTLVNQMYSDFYKDYGYKKAFDLVCKNYSGIKKDYSRPIIISTWQSLAMKKIKHDGSMEYDEYKKIQEENNIKSHFLQQFDMVIADETHGDSAYSRKLIIENCTKAQYRIGMTGSLSEDITENKTIESMIGPIRCEIKTKELQDEGVLAKIKINNVILNYPKEFDENIFTYHEEMEFINQNTTRNIILKNVLSKIPKTDNIMILVKKIDHLSEVKKYLEENLENRELSIIYGNIKASKREDIRNKVIKTDGQILLTTYKTCGTGINIPSLRHVIFFEDIKSKILVLQSLGRGTRKIKDEKDYFTLWDIVDKFHIKKNVYSEKKCVWEVKKVTNYSYRHFLDRLRYYKEQGFEFNIEELFLDFINNKE